MKEVKETTALQYKLEELWDWICSEIGLVDSIQYSIISALGHRLS